MITHIRTFMMAAMLLVSTGFALPAYAVSEEREGGLVGTGLGLLGVITELGSVWVNGLRVVYPPDLRVDTAFGSEPVSRLSVGDTVQIEAYKTPTAWQAFSIQRYQPLISTVEAISPDRKTIVVLQTLVELAPDVALPAGLQQGHWVEISGLWRGAQLIASKVTRVAPLPEHAVRGVLSIAADGTSRVGSVVVEGLRPETVRQGQTLAIRGIPVRTGRQLRLRATRYAVKDFSLRTSRALIEGYLSSSNASSQYTVYGSGVTALADQPFAEMPRSRAVHCATWGHTGVPVITPLIQLPDEERQRRRMIGSTLGRQLQQNLNLCR